VAFGEIQDRRGLHGGRRSRRDDGRPHRAAQRRLFHHRAAVSGFYATNLPVLLPRLGVNRLVLTGIATDICVLFTAADANMRDYELWVPEDAVASESAERTRWALDIMRNSMGAEVRPSKAFGLEAWIGRSKNGGGAR
jgi:nicotinamidase-related amidase